MKKRSLLSIALTPVFFINANAQEKTTLKLSGQLKDSDKKVVYLQKFDNKNFITVDSAIVTNGHFDFKTKVELPELYGLGTNPKNTPYYVFLDRNPIKVVLDEQNGPNTTVTGSALQDEFNAFKTRKDVNISEYLKEKPSSLVSAYILYRNYAYRLTPDQIRENIALLSPENQQSSYVKELHSLLKVLDVVKIGNKAPDFTAKDPQGKEHRLSKNLSAKYTLIDFWAAWCVPCRKENPNVVAAYQKYKSKGFSVIGVSLDKTADAWKEAIKADHLDWLQVSELVFWKSEIIKLYGVRAIPSNFLVDDKGTIVAKNLRGEQLQAKLAELLDKTDSE